MSRWTLVSMFAVVGLGCGSAPATPTCADYCSKMVAASCNSGNGGYESAAACESTCSKAGWTVGTSADTKGSTLGCRVYHAGAAKTDASHCAHAGPSGGNACGTWCEVYCDLALKNCTGTNQLFADRAACTTACGSLATTGKANDAAGNTVQCRIYHLGAAGADAAAATTHCPHGKATGNTVCN